MKAPLIFVCIVNLQWSSEKAPVLDKHCMLSIMKILAVFFALVALASGFKIGTKKAQLIKLAKSNQCEPDETECPFGCCPEANWYCCPGGVFCAVDAEDCPSFEAEKTRLLVKLAKKSSQQWCDGPDETYCPNGFCCPEANWLCCPDDWCAPTLADCP